MSKVIQMRLSNSSISNAINELRNYRNDFENKCNTFVQLLADFGISVATQNLGGYGKYIILTKRVDISDVSAIICMTNTGLIHSEWQNQDGVQSVDISPILMAEFGSGFKAQNPMNVAGVGQGSLNTMGHAFDPNGWSWMDLDGNWHHSKGYVPTQPMYKAMSFMVFQIENIARSVFV